MSSLALHWRSEMRTIDGPLLRESLIAESPLLKTPVESPSQNVHKIDTFDLTGNHSILIHSNFGTFKTAKKRLNSMF
jgi:hypothetical protein